MFNKVRMLLLLVKLSLLLALSGSNFQMTIVVGLFSTLKQSVNTRLSKFEEIENFQLATVLNPHYKLDWCNETFE